MTKQNIAVIGCGDWGKNIARTLYELGHLACICDHHQSRYATDFSQQFSVPLLDFSTVLDHNDITGVVVATRPETHFDIARSALNHNKHVLVEKPLVKTVQDAEALKALAKENKRILMVGHLLKYHPAFVKLAQTCHSGDLGTVVHISSARKNYGKIYNQDSALWDLGPHDLSMILEIAKSPVAQVFATGQHMVIDSLNDIANLHLTFENGITCDINLSRINPFKEQKLTVIGDKAAAIFDDTQEWTRKLTVHKGRLEADDHDHIKAIPDFQGEATVLKSEPPLKLELAHFVECVSTGRAPHTPAHEAIEIMKILIAAEESIQKNKPVQI